MFGYFGSGLRAQVSPLALCRSLFFFFKPHWGTAGQCWLKVSVSVVQCCSVLFSVGQCWSVLVSVGQCWSVLVSVVQCWSVLVSVGQCWSVSLASAGQCSLVSLEWHVSNRSALLSSSAIVTPPSPSNVLQGPSATTTCTSHPLTKT